MTLPPRMPVRQTPGRGWLVAGATASVVLHGAVLAALVLWPAAEPEPERGEEGAVAMVFADIVDAGGAGAAEDPAPPEPPSMPAPPPVPVAAAPPAAPPAPPAPDAGPPAEAGILPPPAPPPPEPAAAPPAEAQPGPASEPPPAPPRPLAEAPPPAQPVPPAQPAPMAEATPDDPPPAPVQVAAPRPQHPARPPSTQGQLRLDAGIGALPDPSFGAQAMGAVVPPGTEAGQRNAPPDYPSESRRRGEEGVVRLALRVGTDGSVLTAEVAVSSGHPRLDAAALEAARRWRFRPATQAGLPVAATLPTAVHFRLTDARGR